MNIEDKHKIGSNDVKESMGQIALPFDENQFKEFIIGLLGKPQTISKRFSGAFEISKDEIITLFEVLNQRVYQQNDSKLIQFRATIYYSDNSTVTLNGIDHLLNYNESLPIVSKAIHLTWQYLIKFRDKTTFEKQEINVSLIADLDSRMLIDDDNLRFSPHSQVHVRIQHTARTWGADIEAVLTRHIESIVKKDGKFFEFFQYNTESVQNLISGVLALITFSFTAYYTYKKRQEPLYQEDAISWIYHYGSSIFLFIGIYFLYKFTLVLLEKFEVFNKPSFILLTSESVKQKAKTLKSFQRNWYKYIWTIIFSLLLGVLGNYVYGLLIH